MKETKELLYSPEFGEKARHVIVDNVCIKSRTSNDLNPDMEKIISEYDNVLVQDNDLIKIYAQEELLDFYHTMVHMLEDDDEAVFHRTHPSVEAIKKGHVTIFTEKHPEGYKF